MILLQLATDDLSVADIEITASVILRKPVTPPNEDRYSFFDVELNEYDSDMVVKDHVKVIISA